MENYNKRQTQFLECCVSDNLKLAIKIAKLRRVILSDDFINDCFYVASKNDSIKIMKLLYSSNRITKNTIIDCIDPDQRINQVIRLKHYFFNDKPMAIDHFEKMKFLYNINIRKYKNKLSKYFKNKDPFWIENLCVFTYAGKHYEGAKWCYKIINKSKKIIPSNLHKRCEFFKYYFVEENEIKPNFHQYYSIKQMIKKEKERYVFEFLSKLPFLPFYNDPMFDMNVFIILIPELLFY